MSVHKSPEIIETDLGNELILLDPRNGEMYSLNEVGRRVWVELPSQPVRRIAELIALDFDVLPEHAEADIALLLEALESAQLVERPDGAD
jgi:hypothetical protein